MTKKDIYLARENYLFCLLLGTLFGLVIAIVIIILFGPCSGGRIMQLDL